MSNRKVNLPTKSQAFSLSQKAETRSEAGQTGPVRGTPSANKKGLVELVGQMRAREGFFASPSQGDGGSAKVVVAVSGGADSMALLHLLTCMRTAWNLDLVVAHLDHNIRPESAADASFVGEMAGSWDLPFETTSLPPDALTAKGNLEATARRLRYQFLAQVAVDQQVDGCAVDVAVAHTANDQAETVLMNLIRGSGLHGLAGMQAVRPLTTDSRPVPGVRVVRPLLEVTRSEVVQYLREHDIPWREDASNQDRTFVRNRVRHEVLPLLKELNPRIVASLCRTATVMRGEVERAEHHTRHALEATRRSSETKEPLGESGRQVCDLPSFRDLSPGEQREALRASARELGPTLTGLGVDTVERLRRKICEEDSSGGPYSWFADLMLTRTQDAFSLHHRDITALAPGHPYLDGNWQAGSPTSVLSAGGEIVVDGWTLRCEEVDRRDLPYDWGEKSTGSPRPRTALNKGKLSRWEAYIDADTVQQLSLGTPRAGQRFEPLGLGGHGKALADYFTDRKVPRFLRSGWPILVDGERVVWVGGHQIAHKVRVTPGSRRVLHLFWELTGR